MNDDLESRARSRLRAAFAAATSPPPPGLARAVRERLPGGPRRAGWAPALAAALIGAAATAAIAAVVVLGRPEPVSRSLPSSEPTPSAPASPEPSASPAPSPPPPPAPTIPVICGASSGPADPGAFSTPITRVATGDQGSYDRFVIEFAGPFPAYSIAPGPTTFSLDPSGRSARVQGSAALVVRIDPIDWTSYSGPADLSPGYANLREARLAESYEGVQKWVLGLAQSGCYRVTLLRNPNRLVIDVPTG